jgi:hypothetical protein
VTGDVGEHFFWGLAWEPADGGGEDRAQGEDGLVDGDQIDYVAGFPAISGGVGFVDRVVYGVDCRFAV